jgi:hypothetical protein
VYERNAFARDRSSEVIDEWDSIHLDGVSWLSSDGTVEMVCRTLGVTATWASDKSGARGVAGHSSSPRRNGVARMDSNVRVMALTLLARCVRATMLALIDKNHRTV